MTKHRKAPLHYSRPDDSCLFVCGLPTTDGDRTINSDAVTCRGCEKGIQRCLTCSHLRRFHRPSHQSRASENAPWVDDPAHCSRCLDPDTYWHAFVKAGVQP